MSPQALGLFQEIRITRQQLDPKRAPTWLTAGQGLPLPVVREPALTPTPEQGQDD